MHTETAKKAYSCEQTLERSTGKGCKKKRPKDFSSYCYLAFYHLFVLAFFKANSRKNPSVHLPFRLVAFCNNDFSYALQHEEEAFLPSFAQC